MALPSIGQNPWGAELNAFLNVAHNSDGSLRQAIDKVVNVLAFGADPTGVADSGAALNLAWNAAYNSGVGRAAIYAPKGNYRLITPVLWTAAAGMHAHKYVTLLGDSWGGTQFWPGTVGMRMLTIQSDTASTFTHFFRIENCTFDSSGLHGGTGIAADSAIYLLDVSHFQILGCNFIGFQTPDKAVLDTLRCAWGQMHQNNFVDNEEGTICTDLAAPDAANPTFGHFISSTLFGPRNSNCIHIGRTSEGTIMSGCHFAFHPSGYSVKVEGFEQTIANNYIYPHTDGQPGGTSIGTGSYRQQGIVIAGGYQVLIAGNFMENAQENPMIDIDNDVARLGGGAQVSILSNTIRETGQPNPEPSGTGPAPNGPDVGDGAVTIRASAGTGITIKGNAFQSNYTDYHIKVEDIGNSKRVDIDNTYEDAPNGTVRNGQVTAGRSVFLANRANDSVRIARHYDPYQSRTREHDIVGNAELFGDGDTTPSVASDAINYSYTGAAVTVTDFDDGFEGQEFFVVPANANFKFAYAGGGPISLAVDPTGGPSPYTIQALHMVRFKRAGGIWHAFIS